MSPQRSYLSLMIIALLYPLQPSLGYVVASYTRTSYRNELAARGWLYLYNNELQKREHDVTLMDFITSTNYTKYNKGKLEEIEADNAAWKREQASEARKFWSEEFSADIRRQFDIISRDATPKSQETVKKMKKVQGQMVGYYHTAEVCSGDNDCLDGKQLQRIMATDNEYATLVLAWKGFRDATGPPMREKYVEFVRYLDEGARDNGYPDLGYYWKLNEMDDPNFQTVAAEMYEQLRPMYVKLHAYVRHKLLKQYGEYMDDDSPIPAHLLGNMWAQQWNNRLDMLAPYGDVPLPDITGKLQDQGWTPLKIFKVAENFYKSLGLDSMTEEFWRNSVIQKPRDGRRAQCHGAAFDLFSLTDFRIRKCTTPTMDDFVSVHHEMGHIEYFMQYRFQPSVYRGPPNAGFHEGVADISSLSVLTPSYLAEVGLGHGAGDERSYMNFLMQMALSKVAFLPFGFLIDEWRWGVFNKSITPENYNRKWWELRIKLQGVMPPVDRSEDDFDPGSKAHISYNVPYIRYFVAFVSQFQFHKALCDTAGHTGPLYKCNIAGSKAAGAKFREFLKLGNSKPWSEALRVLTGQDRLDSTPMVEYFEPLMEWIDKYIEENNVKVGWRTSNLGVNY